MSLIIFKKKKKKKKMDLKDVKNKSSDHAVFNENVWLYLEKNIGLQIFHVKKKTQKQIIILKKIQQTNKESGRGKYIAHV